MYACVNTMPATVNSVFSNLTHWKFVHHLCISQIRLLLSLGSFVHMVVLGPGSSHGLKVFWFLGQEEKASGEGKHIS